MAGVFQLADRRNAELVVDGLYFFRAHAWDGQHLQQARRDLLFQRVVVCQMAGRHELADLLRQRSADALEGLEFAAAHQFVEMWGIEASDDTCSSGVGPRFKRTLALEFQQYADFFKNVNDFLLIHTTSYALMHQSTISRCQWC